MQMKRVLLLLAVFAISMLGALAAGDWDKSDVEVCLCKDCA